jgi:hypothetical protein
VGARETRELVLSTSCSCKTEVVASKGVGAHKNDNVQKIKITYHIKKKRFFPLWVSSGNICLCIFHVCD